MKLLFEKCVTWVLHQVKQFLANVNCYSCPGPFDYISPIFVELGGPRKSFVTLSALLDSGPGIGLGHCRTFILLVWNQIGALFQGNFLNKSKKSVLLRHQSMRSSPKSMLHSLQRIIWQTAKRSVILSSSICPQNALPLALLCVVFSS